MSTTALVLKERLRKAHGDWIEELVTTAINADNSVVSTNLNKHDGGQNDYFNDPSWWCYIVDKANAGVSRQISDYVTSGGTLTVRGAALADDSTNLATIRVSRYDPSYYLNAINDASREIYPNLFRYFDDKSLITGNILPPFNWSTTALLDHYTEPSGTLLKNTDGDYFRNGPTSAKVTATGANDVLALNSTDWPRLLDLQDKTVDMYCWVYPEVADDAFLTIYTIQADGTEQTLNSTTECPAGKWTLLKLETQALNDDLSQIEVRLRVKTTAKYAYFDPPRLIGRNLKEYLLPTDVKDGSICQVYVQSSGYSDYACDDLVPVHWDPVRNFVRVHGGTNEYLRFSDLHTEERRIRLVGYHPLEILSAATNALIDALTVSIDGEQVNLLITYAKYKLYQQEEGFPASEDISRYTSASYKALMEYRMMLPKLQMTKPSSFMRIG